MRKDTLLEKLTLLFALSLIGIVVLMGLMLLKGSWPAIRQFGFSFATTQTWDPVSGEFGALPFIFGTLVSSFVALLLAVPLSLGIAIFLSELASPFLRTVLGFLIELLAAIPSVIYGLWGVFYLVPWLRSSAEPFLTKWFGFLPFFQGAPYGVGILAASLILAVMIIPIISSITRDVLQAVPDHQREAALALGATRWEATLVSVLRYGKSGIIGAVFLGFGRALGETMAVTMVIGNTPQISWSILSPAYTMASVLANEFAEATSDLHLSSLMFIGLTLFLMTLLINSGARFLIAKTAKAGGIE